MQKVKKILNITCYYVLPVALIALSFIASTLTFAQSNEMFGMFGSVAIYLLVLILFAKPLSQIFHKVKVLKYILAFRRQIGVAIFWLSLFHGVLYIRLYELFGWNSFTEPKDNLYLYGLIALIGMVILGLTSNNFSVKKLGKKWKKLHHIAYPVLLIAMMHASIAENHPENAYIAFAIFLALKFVAYKKFVYPRKT